MSILRQINLSLLLTSLWLITFVLPLTVGLVDRRILALLFCLNKS
jgi:hypothetical protein